MANLEVEPGVQRGRWGGARGLPLEVEGDELGDLGEEEWETVPGVVGDQMLCEAGGGGSGSWRSAWG